MGKSFCNILNKIPDGWKVLSYSFLAWAILITGSCSQSEQRMSSQEMKATIRPEREWNVGFVLVDGIYNTELVAPIDIFQHTIFHTDPGLRVFTVASSLDPITTFEGLRILPDFTFKSDSLPLIDIMVVASARNSMGSDLEDQAMIDFVRTMGGKAQYVMSLCDGAFVLAKAGLVVGKESTTFPGDISKYRQMFPHLKVHENVSFVHHGNLITSAGGVKSYESALYLTQLLYGSKPALGIAGGLVINWDLGKVPHLVIE